MYEAGKKSVGGSPVNSTSRKKRLLVIWRGHNTLVDGHHRLKILKAHPEISWSVVEQDFADEDEVKEWIIKNALGTRNLTEADYTMLMATLYKMRKKKVGEHKGNQHTKKMECTQNGNIPNESPKRVSEQLAEELGVAKNTIIRAERFADGLEAADKVVPGFKDEVLSGKVKAQKGEVAELRKQTPDEIKKSVEIIKDRKGLKHGNSALFLTLVP